MLFTCVRRAALKSACSVECDRLVRTIKIKVKYIIHLESTNGRDEMKDIFAFINEGGGLGGSTRKTKASKTLTNRRQPINYLEQNGVQKEKPTLFTYKYDYCAQWSWKKNSN